MVSEKSTRAKALKAVLFLLAAMLFALGCGATGSSPSSTTDTESQPQNSTTKLTKNNDTAKHKGEETGTVRPSYEPTEKVLVTSDDPSLPDGCRPRQVAGLVTNFFDAYNRGDQERLSGFFTPKAEILSWLYSMTEENVERGGRNVSFDSRRELLQYFSKRHDFRDRLRLLEIYVAGRSVSPSNMGPDIGTVVDFSYTFTREADDLPHGSNGLKHGGGGKGAILCKEQRIGLWTAGISTAANESSPPFSLPCREPSGWKPGDVLIACAKRVQ